MNQMVMQYHNRLVRIMLNRNYGYFDKTNIFRLDNIKPEESKVVYGAQSKGLQFISNDGKRPLRR